MDTTAETIFFLLMVVSLAGACFAQTSEVFFRKRQAPLAIFAVTLIMAAWLAVETAVSHSPALNFFGRVPLLAAIVTRADAAIFFITTLMSLAFVALAPWKRITKGQLTSIFLLLASLVGIKTFTDIRIVLAFWLLSATTIRLGLDRSGGLELPRSRTRFLVAVQSLELVLAVAGATVWIYAHNQAVGALFLGLAGVVRAGTFPFHALVAEKVRHERYALLLVTCTSHLGFWLIADVALPGAGAGQAFLATVLLLIGIPAALLHAFLLLGQTRLSGLVVHLAGLQAACLLLIAGPDESTRCLAWANAALSFAGIASVAWCLRMRGASESLTEFSGYIKQLPAMGGVFIVSSLAAVNIPFSAGFVAQERVLHSDLATSIKGVLVFVVLLGSVGLFRAYGHIFLGENPERWALPMIKRREQIGLSALVLTMIGVVTLTPLLLP